MSNTDEYGKKGNVNMLQFTGHAFFDIGLATMTAYVGKDAPTELTHDDFSRVADYIEAHYPFPPLSSSVLNLSLMNSAFTQPTYKNDIERRQAYARLMTRSIGKDMPVSGEQCVFTGHPALGLSLSLRKEDPLPPGRAYRQHIPRQC